MDPMQASLFVPEVSEFNTNLMLLKMEQA